MRTRDEIEFDNCFGPDGVVLPSVTRIRVPVKLMDSADPKTGDYTIHHFGGRAPLQIDSAAWDTAIKAANARAARYQPGPITRDARVRDALADCYADYDLEIASQYKNGAGSSDIVGQRPGDLCTIDGRPGHLRSINGQLKCVPDRKPADLADHVSVMDALYSEYDENLRRQYLVQR